MAAECQARTIEVTTAKQQTIRAIEEINESIA
jgi:hypothetical protein